MLMSASLCLIIVAGKLEGSVVENGTIDPSCEYSVVNKTVHIGWPFYFSCYDLVHQLRFAVGYAKFRSQYMKQNATCTLRDIDGTMQWEITATVYDMSQLTKLSYPGLFDVVDNTTTYHILEMNIAAKNYCSYQDIRLKLVEFVNNLTCANSENFPTTRMGIGKGGHHRMQCIVDYGEDVIIYDHKMNQEDFRYEWTHNCETTLPKNTRIAGSELVFTNAEFGVQNGIYTCNVVYKGRKRFVTRHEVCIRHVNDDKVSVNCPKKVEAKLGSDVNITCNVDFGPGPFMMLSVWSNWNKTTPTGDNIDFCSHFGVVRYGNSRHETTNSTVNERAQCETVQISNINERCFLKDPSPKEKEAMTRLTRVTLLIKKMTQSDVGSYTLEFKSGSGNTFFGKVDLKIDIDDHLIDNAKYIGIGILLLVLLIILIVLCFWRKIDILWFMKKHFGAYEQDNKKYLVYLSYHFSNENMSERSENLTINLVDGLNTFFDEFGGKVYDDHKDENELQLQIENMAKVQTQCHRIVIILNPEYVTDHWSLHKAYSALRNMIEGGAKVIFIALPGTEKSFNKIENEPKTALKHAMRMNTTIEWSGKTPLSGTFCRHLKYALPKIRKEDHHQRVKMEADEKILIENLHAA